MNFNDDVELVARETDSQRASTEAIEPPTAEWRPRRQETLIMVTLSLISLMVALDASILVPALPVRSALTLKPLVKLDRDGDNIL